MSSNPYAKKLGASARQQKLQADQQADLYTFDPSAAANDLIAATIGAAQAGGGAGGANAFGYDGFMPAAVSWEMTRFGRMCSKWVSFRWQFHAHCFLPSLAFSMAVQSPGLPASRYSSRNPRWRSRWSRRLRWTTTDDLGEGCRIYQCGEEESATGGV